MRPKIAMWSDYRSPTQRRWRSPYRRNTRSSTGLKILLIAVVSVAGVIGISGIYPQIIDSEWMRNAGTHAKKPAIAEAPTTRRGGIVTAIPLSPRYDATTTGEAAASAPRAATSAPAVAKPPAAAKPPTAAQPPAVAEPPTARTSVAAVELSQPEIAPPAADTQAVADPATDPAPTATAVMRPAVVRQSQRNVARAPVVKRHVARTEHPRSYSGAYAQYGGGWSWSSQGSPFHF